MSRRYVLAWRELTRGEWFHVSRKGERAAGGVSFEVRRDLFLRWALVRYLLRTELRRL